MSESRSYPDRIYAGHLGGGRRTWKPELFDATERAHSCEYVRHDIVAEILEALKIVLQHGRIDDSENRMNMVSEIIAKAEGRP